MPVPHSDQDLVELARHGQTHYYGELMRRYQQKLLRYARFLVKNPHLAEDVVQTAFIKAYQNLYRFDTNRSFSSWIYRVAHNEAMNELKKRPSANFEMVNERELSRNPEYETQLQTNELRRALRQCLDQISLKYRTPLVLYYLEEKTYEEISDILRIPINTVGTLLSRGKKIIAKYCHKLKE